MNTITPSRAALGAAAAALLLAAAALPAQAQDERVLLETARVTTYLDGGIGADQEASMRRVAKDWPLRMTFSERKDGEFAADVNLVVTDARGAPVLVLHDTGPMTYAMLPAGTYRLSATLHGITETREVTLDGRHGRDVQFHWRGQPKLDPWDGRPVGGGAVPG